jgi:hypothetical protein
MPRVVIVYDGRRWYMRRLDVSRHDLDDDEMIYHCDLHLGGPYESPEEAVRDLRCCYPESSRKVR